MAERKLVTALQWILTIALVLYAFVDWGNEKAPAPAESSDEAATSKLRITSISDAEVTQGDAIVVRYEDADEEQELEAKISKRDAEIIVREVGSVVVRIPRDMPNGKGTLRLVQGTQRSKGWDLQIRPQNTHKLVGRLVGGLALFVYGLGLLAIGVRGLAGHNVRNRLGALTRRPTGAVAFGVLVGAVTQLTTSAAALGVSLVGARLLALAPTIALLVGAQLGASITGALLPVGLAHESLLVIAIGVVWARLAESRRAQSIGQLVLGTGLMLYGLHLLQTSVEPLVGDPQILPYVQYMRENSVPAWVVCAGTGALLAFVLQGPGPVYVLVIGLSRVAGALPLSSALAILAGANLGAAAGMALVAWQSRPARALAAPHLLFGACATVLSLAMLPVWTALADALLGGHAAAPYRHSVVELHLTARVALGFAGSQLVVVALWLVVLPRLMRRVEASRSGPPAPPVLPPEAVADGARTELVFALGQQRKAVSLTFETSCTGDRARAAHAEEALATARRRLEEQLALVAPSLPLGDAMLDRMSRTLAATLQLQRIVEQLVELTELTIERGLRLSTEDRERLGAIESLVQESFTAVTQAIESNTEPDLEAAGAREIQINQLEAKGRTKPVTPRTSRQSTASISVGLPELLDSYEHVGNHLYRVCQAMVDEDELA